MFTNSVKIFFLSTFLGLWIFISFIENASAQLPPRINSSFGAEFVLIPAGKFVMGPGEAFLGPVPDGLVRRSVSIKKPFYMSLTEITQLQWFNLTGIKPAYRKGENNPVENVSYKDATEALEKLNAREGRGLFRLPTEAEWEYAARAGTSSNYFFGDSPEQLKDYAWYDEDLATGGPHPVRQKKPNPFGLFDVYGNVYEWTSDTYDYGQSKEKSVENFESLLDESMMVIKGGCYTNQKEDLQSASRFMELPLTRSMLVGLRLVYVPD
jgi:formylglycine-generating enzyme required for sulfatase activity